jgi:tetratricopeptide (TPR) repeat protein
MSNYPTTFCTYILGAVRYALVQVQATPNLLSDEVRQQALHALSYALDLPEAWPVTRDLLLAMAPKMEQAGHREDWMPYIEAGVAQSQRLYDQTTEAALELKIGFILQLQSRFEQARERYQTSAKIYDRIGQRDKYATALNQLAFIAWLQHHYHDIPPLLESALQLLAEDDPERANSYLVLGWIAFDAHDAYTAGDYFQKALALRQRQGDQRQIAGRLRDLGAALRMQQRYAESIACHEQARALFDEIGNRFEQAVTQMNLGVVYLLLEQADNALTQFAAVEPVFRTLQDLFHLAMLYTNQGIAYRLLGDWNKAITALQVSIGIWEQLNHSGWHINALDELGMAYLAAGQANEAYIVLQMALERLAYMNCGPDYHYYLANITAHLNLAASTSSPIR